MKKITLLLLFISLTCSVSLVAQCLSTVYVSPNPWGGDINLDIEYLVEQGTTYDSYIIQAYELNCDDINLTTPIELSLITGSDTTTCTIQVIVVDNVPPVVVVRQEYEICLNENGIYELDYTEIDNGSFDGCSETLTYELSISTFDFSNLGDNIVYLRVYDEYGNWNETWMNVYVANADFECVDYVSGNLGSGGSPAIFEKEAFLTNSSNPCSATTLMVYIYDDQGNNLGGTTGDVEIETAGNYTFELVNFFSIFPTFGESCTGDLVVYDQVSNACTQNLSPTDISWPIELSIAADYQSENDIQALLEPINISDKFSLTYNEVQPLVSSTCQNMANSVTKTDEFLEFDVMGSAKVLRTWTVLDIINQTPYTSTQLITVYQKNTLICDTNSNDFPVGDCGSGHSTDDDVEWPADIILEDARISPEQLMIFSNIAAINAQPQFINNTSDYYSTYTDKVIAINNGMSTIERTWRINRLDIRLDISYIQTITINLNSVRQVAQVNTFTNRAIANVELATGIFTDANGSATIPDGTTPSPFYQDAGNNGLDILDLLKIQNHILGLNTFESDIQSRIADLNSNGSISAIDIVELRKHILLINDPIEDWTFEKQANSLNLDINYFTGYKLGDVDDSAALSGQNNPPSSEIVMEDILLNNGQSYNLPVHFRNVPLDLEGIELHLEYDTDLLEITDVSSIHNTNAGSLDYNIENGKLHIVFFMDENAQLETMDDLVLNALHIEFNALANGTIGNVFSGIDAYPSMVADENLGRHYFDLEIKNEITSSTLNLNQTDKYSVFPNPTNGLLFLNYEDVAIQELSIEIFNLAGKKVFMANGQKQLDVSFLNNGMYIYTISDQANISTGKIIIE